MHDCMVLVESLSLKHHAHPLKVSGDWHTCISVLLHLTPKTILASGFQEYFWVKHDYYVSLKASILTPLLPLKMNCKLWSWMCQQPAGHDNVTIIKLQSSCWLSLYTKVDLWLELSCSYSKSLSCHIFPLQVAKSKVLHVGSWGLAWTVSILTDWALPWEERKSPYSTFKSEIRTVFVLDKEIPTR